MNAGAFGQETWNHVVEVETIDRHGTLKRRGRADFSIAYRSVRGVPQEWFTAAVFKLEPDEPSSVQARISARVAERNASQPMGVASCGSVFRNPPGYYAARLIESAGLKGCSVGGASVSLVHANFIVNEGAASAADIEILIQRVQSEVAARFGVSLEPEVRIVGEQVL
jgi:UDP-N-acetylmuramate dehydrogenase